MASVSIHLFTHDSAQTVDPHTADFLAVQGFSGGLGQVAIVTDGGLTVFVGLGNEMSAQSVMHALPSSLPEIPRGTEVRVLGLPSELTGLANSILAVAGLHPESTTRHSLVLAEAVAQAQKLTNAPGAVLYPTAFSREAQELAASAGVTAEVLGLEELVAGGFGGIVGVGQGSFHPPCLIDLRYEPKHPRAKVTLVGKGITFDTGGLSLKSPAGMMSMRMDKAGASAVLAGLCAVARLELPVAVRGLLPMAENMIGPSATRPGDTVIARNGRPIQVMDTDFEGRVVLADALAYAGEEQTDMIIDVATLTYQVAIALGDDVAGLFSNDDGLADGLLAAAGRVGEGLWRLPLVESYRDQVVTPTGVKNHPEKDVGRAITAAMFLQEFVPQNTAWAHLDYTGPAWRGPASGEGSTGFAVRTMVEFLETL